MTQDSQHRQTHQQSSESGISFGLLSLLTGQTISMIGDHFGGMALSILILQITGSATAMSLNMILTMIPTLVLGPAAGIVLDKVNRKHVLVVSDLARGLLTLGLGWLIYTGHFTVIHAYAWAVVTSLFRVLYDPGTMAVLPALVPPQGLQRANAFQTLSKNLAMIIGPALAGLVVGQMGPWFALSANAASFGVAALSISLVHPRAEERSTKTGRPRLSEIREGFAFFKHTPIALTLLTITVVVNACSQPVGVALNFHVLKTLAGKPSLLGLASSAYAGASVLSSLVIASRKRALRFGSMLVFGIVGSGLSYILIGLAPALGAVPVAFAIVGLMGPIIQVPIQTLYQDITPADMRGRVFALRMSLSQVLSPLSFALCGVLLDGFGSRAVFMGLGLALALAGVAVRVHGKLRDV